ncbi:MAG: hypothetical protein LBT02_02065 [Rickettsiales bacterium]|jgi:hypothetical protein|nr:hypothetical protein [Rickettsiales bacterium]
MKKIFLFLFFLSCASVNKSYICSDDFFDIRISGNLSKVEQKQLSNIIMNESGIKYSINSEKEIILEAIINEAGTLLSAANTVDLKNIILNIKFRIVSNEKIIYSGLIKTMDTTNYDTKKRFVSVLNKKYSYNNLFLQAGKEVKNRIDILLNSCLK